MREDLDKKLCKEFPNLYGDRNTSMTDTCMCWGFQCGDGWFQLIYDLSVKLEALILDCPEEEREQYRAAQVKEKWGTLSFYMTSGTGEMWKVIEEAEKNSQFVCELCGEPGELRGGSWILCLCDKCQAKR